MTTVLLPSYDTNLLSYPSGSQSVKWLLLALNQGVGRVVFLPEALEENLFPCLFQFLETIYFLGLWLGWPLLPSSKSTV